MKNNKFEQGQALVLVTLAIVGLVGITGLVVDGGMTYYDRQTAQNAADSAAFSAALAKVRGGNISTSATAIAAKNGYDNNTTPGTVVVNNPPVAGCDGTTSPYAGNSEYVQVLIYSAVDTYFAPVIGIQELNNCVEAVTRASVPVVTESTLFEYNGGNGLVALAPTGESTCRFNSNAHMTITGAGIFCNSDHARAVMLNSNVDLNADAYNFVGGYHVNGGGELNGGPIHTGVPAIPYPPDFSMIPDPPSAPTCSTSGSKSGDTFYPGNFNGITLDSNDSAHFTSGVYCIQNYFNINGSNTITGDDVTFVINNVNINFGSIVNATFDNLEIYTNNGSFQLNSNGTTHAERFRFYATGNGAMIVNDNYNFTSNDAFLYIPHGTPQLNSNGIVQMTAPSSGPYAGLIYYLPLTNNNYVNINSNADFMLNGTYLAPAVKLTLNSNADTVSMDSQIIVYTVTINSNARLNLNFDASVLYTPSDPGSSGSATIKLVQ